MYMIRRVCKTHPGKAWEVAGYLTKIVDAYSSAGRAKAQVYHGSGLPGDQNVVYAEWVQETIEPSVPAKVPAAVREEATKMMPLVNEYYLEFFELVTPEKLQGRGLA